MVVKKIGHITGDEFFTLYPSDAVREVRFIASEQLSTKLALAGNWAAVEKIATDYFKQLVLPPELPPCSNHLALAIATLDRCLKLERLLVANDLVLAEIAGTLVAQNPKGETT